MTQVEIPDAARAEHGGYRVDVSRGERNGRVSSEWFSRPADERYLSLSELFAAVRGRAARSRTVESAAMRVEASHGDADRLALVLPGENMPLVPTHWSFGQLASLVGAPATYLRQLPAPPAGINLQYGLTSQACRVGQNARGRPQAREYFRFRAGHHGSCPRQAPPGCAARSGGAGEEAARSGSLTPVMPLTFGLPSF